MYKISSADICNECRFFSALPVDICNTVYEVVDQDATLPLESDIQELAALTHIFVVCKNEHSAIAEKIFTLDLLKTLGNKLVSDLIRNVWFGQKDYTMAINTHITKISQCTTPDREHVIVTLTNMYPDLSYGKKRIVMGINNNLIQKLLITPLNDLTTISESELWSISFNLMLSVLISDPDRLIHLRWTNTIPAAENGNSRSDTIISETPQMDFTSNVGFGFNITFYITQLTASGIYTSVDIGHNNILFPQSLEDLPSFFTVATLNRLITIHDTFWHCCKKSKHPDAIKSRYKPTLLTLDDPMIDPSQDSKHSCQLRCGH